ncbi:hypothetical protein BZG36_00629 [Bifiguratus adelaidae]|uniref:Uncharacterized protein n=1 Tax=Bifiguratus adelaidae TaxID=1938954 RepID=A0A261Y7N2_9FUNG|nr:hypothetical protein BZG36_00629 [Bifiguratus adelaidae]
MRLNEPLEKPPAKAPAKPARPARPTQAVKVTYTKPNIPAEFIESLPGQWQKVETPASVAQEDRPVQGEAPAGTIQVEDDEEDPDNLHDFKITEKTLPAHNIDGEDKEQDASEPIFKKRKMAKQKNIRKK